MRVALGVALVALPSFAQQYHSNDLTPPYANAGKLNGAARGKQVGAGSNNHAYIMTGNALTAVDLHPVGYAYSVAVSSDDTDQCGYAYSNLGGIHAIKWTGGSSTNFVDLQPSGYNFSYCTAEDNGEQGGFAEQQSYATTASHAMLWHGTSVPTDLHPLTGSQIFSRVMSIKSGEQVGYDSAYAYPYGDYPTTIHYAAKARLWHGTADSTVVLHPLGWDASEALATNGTQQGGWALKLVDSQTHAMLWTGTADTAVDLHPAGYTASKITAIFGNQQVGEGWVGTPGAIGSVRHALLWTGTPESVVDLNQYLPAGYANGVATGMDVDGNVVGYAYNNLVQGLFVGGDSIAVVFAPGAAPASSLTSITLDKLSVNPGASMTATVTLATPAPAGGVTITFLSTDLTLAGTPAPVTIAEGQSSTSVPVLVLGSTLTAPKVFKLFASDGVISRSVSATVAPIVNISSITMNAVEGGFGSTGVVSLTIPAQLGGAVVSLTSGDPLVTVPATVSVYQYQSAVSFAVTTKAVSAPTTVPVSATFNGVTVTTNVVLSPAPVITLSSMYATATVVGGQTLYGSVSLNNFVRDAAGVTVTLTSSDPTVQMPASVVIPQGYASVAFYATTSVVNAATTATLSAAYNGGSATSSVTVNPIPPITILTADWKSNTQILKVTANSPDPNVVLTYGANGVPFGTMQLELGVWQGSIVMANPPTTITVWSSVGATASMAVTGTTSGGGKTSSGGTTSGGGGGTTSSTTFTLTAKTSGKGNFVSNPVGISCGSSKGSCSKAFPAGQLVNLTATPDAGAIFLGWTGDCAGNITSCTVTMDKARSVTANFK